MNVDVSPDFVALFGQKLHRPSHVSPSVWMKDWELIKEILRGGSAEFEYRRDTALEEARSQGVEAAREEMSGDDY